VIVKPFFYTQNHLLTGPMFVTYGLKLALGDKIKYMGKNIMTMTAEILSTGDEILSGNVMDGNSAHIAQKLEETGAQVVRQSCVGDDMHMLVSVLKEIAGRADVAVVTGGLGPTIDDLSAEAAARAAGVELVFDPTAMGSIDNYFKTRKRPMTLSDNKQAMLPKGADCLVNPVGTAPGFMLKIDGCVFFFLPGVPFEMRHMLSQAVLPYIEKCYGNGRRFSMVKTISLFGLSESAVNERLVGLSDRFSQIKLGLRARFPEIYVKLYARGENESELDKRIDEALAWTLERVGEWTFSVDGSSMEAEVGRLLCRKKAAIAVAESCTGGLISNWFTNVPGSSEYFLFSGVTYSNQAKIDVLGVSPDTIKQYGAVHERTAIEMAQGARRVAGATYGISTSGIAGPGGGTDDKPVGTLFVGIATPNGSKGHRFNLSFATRLMNKRIFAMTALDLLRRELLGS